MLYVDRLSDLSMYVVCFIPPMNEKNDSKGNKKKIGIENYPLYCLSGDIALIGNGVCNEALNNPQCHYDGGDCN